MRRTSRYLRNVSDDITELEGHSAAYFGAYRDLWWNIDDLALLASRWNVEGVASVLDVGCGVGHWGRALLNVLPATAVVVGVDREPRWVETARERARHAHLDTRLSYVSGDANDLPFGAASFDMVTCQTVLIHLADPSRALKDMLRVLRPGGLLVAVEPNNLAQAAILGSSDVRNRPRQAAQMFEFQLTCERGKARLGLGDNSVGDLVPGLLHALGCADVRVYLSDKCSPLFPPYTAAEQRVNVAQAESWASSGFWIWDEQETRRYWEAGGGAAAAFATYWQLARDLARELLDDVRGQRFHGAGAAVMYVVSARKPH